MDKMVIIVGTSHEYQWAGKNLSENEISLFYAFIISLAKKHGIRAIAEEMSVEALKKENREHSTLFQVSKTLNICHQYSDPEIGEQERLGILNEGTVEYYGKYRCNWSRHEIDNRIENEDRKREAVWLSKIEDLNTWPLLFICGSKHTIPFRKLLAETGYIVHLEVENWVA